jgi:hypothetical protein
MPQAEGCPDAANREAILSLVRGRHFSIPVPLQPQQAQDAILVLGYLLPRPQAQGWQINLPWACEFTFLSAATTQDGPLHSPN